MAITVALSASINPSRADISLTESYISALLHQRSVLDLHQDQSGMLWIITVDGLSRFNGHRLIDYRPDSSRFIPSNGIKEILESNTGDIIVLSTDSEIFVYNRSLDSFRHFEQPKHISQGTIKDALFLNHDELWLARDNGTITSIDLNHMMSSVMYKNQDDQILGTEFHEGSIFILTSANEIHRLSTSKPDELTKYSLESCASETGFKSILPVAQEIVFIASRGTGVYRLNLATNNCSSVADRALGQANINDLYWENEKGQVWLATNLGLFVTDGSAIEKFDVGNSQLIDNEIVSFSTGSRDRIWVGTFNGLYIATRTIFDLFEGEKLKSVSAIDSDSNGDIWVASSTGLSLAKDGGVRHVAIEKYFPKANTNGRQIMALEVTKDTILIGYRAHGLELIDRRSGEVEIVNETTEKRITSNAVSSIIKIENGDVLIGTFGGGVNLIQAERGISEVGYEAAQDQREDREIIFIEPLENWGTIVGSEGGLFRYDSENHSMSRIATSTLDKATQHSAILDVIETSNGELWAATLKDGLLRSRKNQPDSNTIIFDSLHLGSIKTIYSLERDPLGDVWASTNNGLIRISPDDLEITRYTGAHGLQGKEFDFGASHSDKRGNLYFGGAKGYNKVRADVRGEFYAPPAVYLVDLIISGEKPILSVPIEDLREIHLNHKDHSISFEFSVLDFLSPADNQYRYKLQGFDPDWVEAGSRNHATYTNLPAGEYLLRVQGADSMGVWNRDGITILITKEHPPWLRWWAWCVYISIFLFLCWLAKRYFTQVVVIREARKHVEEVSAAADIAIDELHEQLDFQREIVNSARSHSLQTLDFIRELIRSDGTHRFDERMANITIVESNIAYHGDELLVDFHQAAEEMVQAILPSAGVPVESITTINRIEVKHLPIDVAVPLAVILGEALHASLTGSFERESLANYLEFRLFRPPHSQGEGRRLQFLLSDSGTMAPQSLQDWDSQPESGLIVSICRQNAWKLCNPSHEGSRIEIDIPDTWSR